MAARHGGAQCPPMSVSAMDRVVGTAGMNLVTPASRGVSVDENLGRPVEAVGSGGDSLIRDQCDGLIRDPPGLRRGVVTA